MRVNPDSVENADKQVQRLQELVQKLEQQNSKIRTESAAYQTWNRRPGRQSTAAVPEKSKLRVLFNDIDEDDDLQWLIRSPYKQYADRSAESTRQWLITAAPNDNKDQSSKLLSQLRRPGSHVTDQPVLDRKSHVSTAGSRTNQISTSKRENIVGATQSSRNSTEQVTTSSNANVEGNQSSHVVSISSSFQGYRHHNRFGYRCN
ncbi:hypothetical protein BOX15_Mlig008757g1 [Macrostomum lignano]|uniref:Uncharacterized protein n=1 Tax=Macrostomum lignano TaxID=282301 RepID=A0A267H3V8_9PLAT|nr:hypothetical protein BOX15_Mlig008757g1 [Macrostomum lignano]